MTDRCPWCGQDTPAQIKNHSEPERLSRLLGDIIGSTIPICRKQIKALMLKGWNVGKIEVAIKEKANPGMKPWDWTAEVTSRHFRAEPKRDPLPVLTYEEMAKAADMPLEDWLKSHKIGEGR